jgi:hypothetical protein
MKRDLGVQHRKLPNPVALDQRQGSAYRGASVVSKKKIAAQAQTPQK